MSIEGTEKRDILVNGSKDTEAGSQKYIPLTLMTVPGLLYLVLNNYLPMFGIIIAFKNINYSKGILGSEWIGLKILNICLKHLMLTKLREIRFSIMWYLLF